MVDALHAVHRSLRRHGALYDVRPDPDRPPRIELRRRVLGALVPTDLGTDRAADRAIATVVGEGKLRLLRRGHFWHRFSFPDFASLDRWVSGQRRFGRYAPGLERRLRARRGPFTARRAIAFEVYERV